MTVKRWFNILKGTQEASSEEIESEIEGLEAEKTALSHKLKGLRANCVELQQASLGGKNVTTKLKQARSDKEDGEEQLMALEQAIEGLKAKLGPVRVKEAKNRLQKIEELIKTKSAEQEKALKELGKVLAKAAMALACIKGGNDPITLLADLERLWLIRNCNGFVKELKGLQAERPSDFVPIEAQLKNLAAERLSLRQFLKSQEAQNAA